MSCKNVQILNFNHNIVEVGPDNKIVITDQIKCNSITIPQPVTNILQINSPGPQGPVGPVGNVDVSSFVTTSSFNNYTGSNISQFAGTSSYATTASYALNGGGGGSGAGFPYSGSAVITGSLLVSGSGITVSGSLNADNITGSLQGTASWAYNALTASLAPDYVLNSATSSFVQNSQTSSFVTNTQTSSFLTTGSYNTTQTISGSLIIDQNLTVLGTQSIQYITSSQLNISTNLITVNTATPAVRFGGLAVYDSGSTGTGKTGSILWDSQNDNWVYSNPSGSSYDGAVILVGPRNTTGLGNEAYINLGYAAVGDGGHHMTSSAIYSSGSLIRLENNTQVTGSLNVSQGITGSLFGTASWANNAVTASYITGSIFTSTNPALSASFATSASRAVTSSFALSANVFPFTGSAIISGSLTVTGSTNLNGTAGTTLFSSNADTLTITGSLLVTGSATITGSLNVTSVTSSLFGTASWATNAATASFLPINTYQITSSWAVSASQAVTASYILASRVAGLSLTQIASDSVTASVTPTQFSVVSASITEFTVTGTGVTIGSAPTDTHQVTGSLNINGAVTATSFTGNGANLTNITAAVPTGKLVAIATGYSNLF